VLQLPDKSRSTDFLQYFFICIEKQGFPSHFPPRVTEENPQFDKIYVTYFSLRQNSNAGEYIDKGRVI
jgi:hypothetical protein